MKKYTAKKQAGVVVISKKDETGEPVVVYRVNDSDGKSTQFAKDLLANLNAI